MRRERRNKFKKRKMSGRINMNDIGSKIRKGELSNRNNNKRADRDEIRTFRFAAKFAANNSIISDIILRENLTNGATE